MNWEMLLTDAREQGRSVSVMLGSGATIEGVVSDVPPGQVIIDEELTLHSGEASREVTMRHTVALAGIVAVGVLLDG